MFLIRVSIQAADHQDPDAASGAAAAAPDALMAAVGDDATRDAGAAFATG
jgi:hypothetical protein